MACAKVTSHWCPVGCLAWKAARELCVSCGWYQLAGIVCRRWQGPGGALVVLYFACLDPARLEEDKKKKSQGAGEAPRAGASLPRESYQSDQCPV